jgi:hypothetical protein
MIVGIHFTFHGHSRPRLRGDKLQQESGPKTFWIVWSSQAIIEN